MVNWKESGEVPDSEEEEESFESQEIEGVSTLPPGTKPEKSQKPKNIWDFPDSQEDELAQDPTLVTAAQLDSSPLSSPLSSLDLPSVDYLTLTQSKPDHTDSSPTTARVERVSAENNEDTSAHYKSTPIRSPAALPVALSAQNDTLLQIQELGHNTEEHEVRQAAIRYERSLRPRKPIQEHPYLLENAHYSSSLKKHGVRPWRVAVEAERRRRQETAQDDDFEEDSQESALPAASEESQALNADGPLEEFEVAAVLSSSPPKTSPWRNGAVGSSQTSSVDDTDNTSVLGQDLPTLEDLLKPLPRLVQRKTSKRRTTPPRSVARKRRRNDIVDSDPAESTILGELTPRFLNSHASPSYNRHDQEEIPAITSRLLPVIDISSDEADTHTIRKHRPSTSQNETDSEADLENDNSIAIDTIGRRIRGVLPASWLRLDQQSGRDKVQTQVNQRHREKDASRDRRRGVAQPRQGLPTSTALHVWSDESDTETVPVPRNPTDSSAFNQTVLEINRVPSPSRSPTWSYDDEESAIEEDIIEPMAISRKHQLKLSDSFRSIHKRPKTTKKGNNGKLGNEKRQPKITSQLRQQQMHTASNGSKPTQQQAYSKTSNRRQKDRGVGSSKHNIDRMPPPPQLSILDIIQPDAPRFLKIAARTARQHGHQGRSSPSKKTIRLANRIDHVDAVSVLDAWKIGRYQQRPSVSASINKVTSRRRTPLAARSGNGSPGYQEAHTKNARGPRKFVKHVSDGGSISYQPNNSSRHNFAKGADVRRSTSLAPARPAQLEMKEADQTRSGAFHAQKKILDRLYHRAYQPWSSTSSIGGLEANVDRQSKADHSANMNFKAAANPSAGQHAKKNRPRTRKTIKPARIDIDAPQYSHASDPLPRQLLPEAQTTLNDTEEGKLLGLGPYGTQYTLHFEIFPMDPGVYFHESTLIGSGILKATMRDDYIPKLSNSRPHISFTLGNQVLRWGPWTSEVSSELGILLDFVAENLANDATESPQDTSVLIDALSFLLRYIQESLSFAQADDMKSFIDRGYQGIRALNQRIKDQLQNFGDDSERHYSLVARMYDRLMLSTWLILKVCRSESSFMTEQIRLEELVGDVCRTAASVLLRLGIGRVKETYEHLHSLQARERGLRHDTPAIHSWVVMIQVLQQAHVPRLSFWDLAQGVMGSPSTILTNDACDLERLWENMFILLPLVEFNDSGVVISGRRHDVVGDGWTMPRQLLKRVFHLYQQNIRQSPNFNNYCRAIVGRCHYLTQQWGWQRNVPIIGVIFDFFGSQNFAHLRNEEVYKSPKFLENLASNPSMEIEAEDRCFHVFLKLIALSIQKLKRANLSKDIRNLVARTIPNHNRQHLKEQDVHERDLAALRNHHDLLGTLFWASPPDMRPAVNLLERLVIPASSHKEACLISLRSWSQLARFVVASGEATTAFKPFLQWRNNFSQQMMQVFDSVASDIQQQLLTMSKDVSRSIGSDMVNAMISVNKAAVMDVLHFAVTASLDVIKQAPDLGSATFCLNTLQLQQIFKHFAIAPPELDWGILAVSLNTLDYFLGKIDDFTDNEESQQSESQLLEMAQSDDALLIIDHDIARSFYAMTRCVISTRESRGVCLAAPDSEAACVEQAVKLSARIGARFITAGLVTLSGMLGSGKYGVFGVCPSDLGAVRRRYLVLFTTTLLQYGWEESADADFSLSELWMLSITKPQEQLAFEHKLAEQLCRRQKEFVCDNIERRNAGKTGYDINRDRFEHAISNMRCSIRDAAPSLRKILNAEHSRTLTMVMEQIKGDLHVAAEHETYLLFVQDIISLIKAHGSDIVTVDKFFYQISKEYSPSVHDPQLAVAGLISYGHRLRDGDGTSGHQLFFLLLSNAKISMTNGNIGEGIRLLQKGIKNQGMLDFVLGKMFPAIIRAAFSERTAFPLLDMYVRALALHLSESVAANELGAQDVPQLVLITKAASDCIDGLGHGGGALSVSQIYCLTQLLTALISFFPSLLTLSASTNVTSTAAWKSLSKAMGRVRNFASRSDSCLYDLNPGEEINQGQLFAGWNYEPANQSGIDPDISIFTENIVQDVRKGWNLETGKLTIRMPAVTQPKEVDIMTWNMAELTADFHEHIQAWCWWWERVYGPPRRSKHVMNPVF